MSVIPYDIPKEVEKKFVVYQDLDLVDKKFIGEFVKNKLNNSLESVYMPMSEWKKIINKICWSETFKFNRGGEDYESLGCDIDSRSVFDVMLKGQKYFKKSNTKKNKKYEYCLL
tara:strand:- start:593 stop:934 length:342 start_codon:yes stop_codon:yes gene_type:complete